MSYEPLDGVDFEARTVSVVLDTTAFYNNYDVRGAEWDQLFAISEESANVQVVIPEVVIKETARHYRREATRVDRSAISALSDTLKSLGKVISVPTLNLRALREELRLRREGYEQELRQTLSRHGVTIADTPDMPTSQLLQWAIDERQPFKDSGEGFRDALIWGTVLALSAGDAAPEVVVFVSSNTRDFGAPDGSLADALSNDLEVLGSRTEVHLVGNLREALEALAPEAAVLRSEREARASLVLSVSEIFATDPEDLLLNSVTDATDALTGSVLANVGNSRVLEVSSASGRVVSLIISMPADLSSASIYDIEAIPETISWTEQDRYSDRILGEASIDADLIVDGTVPSDAYELIEANWDPYLIDDEFNPKETPVSQVWIAFQVLVRLRFRAAIDANLHSVEDLELETIEAVF